MIYYPHPSVTQQRAYMFHGTLHTYLVHGSPVMPEQVLMLVHMCLNTLPYLTVVALMQSLRRVTINTAWIHGYLTLSCPYEYGNDMRERGHERGRCNASIHAHSLTGGVGLAGLDWTGLDWATQHAHAHALALMLTLPALRCCTDTRIHTWHAAVREAWEPDCARK